MPRIAINGLGRIGRLVVRHMQACEDLTLVAVNEVAGDAGQAARLLARDTLHGAWNTPVSAQDQHLIIDQHRVRYSQEADPAQLPWHDLELDLVIDCTGQFKTRALLAPYLEQSAPRVLVSAPLPDGIPNIVFGVNDRAEPLNAPLLSAASCTTNCIAPIVRALVDNHGIDRGTFTTVHCITNTQALLDRFHKDPRRARAAGTSLIPTTTGSATAIGRVVPEVSGKLDGIAIRVPVANASIADCVFELSRSTTLAAVEQTLQDAAAAQPDVLGYETEPLVSVDYLGDRRSGVVDAPSLRLLGGTHLKVLAWYDNESGYVARMLDLAQAMLAARPHA